MDAKIEFVSMVEGLADIEECRPKPAKHFVPQWFKDIPANPNQANLTAKRCPSFTDYFSLGYVMPMWTDFKLKYEDQQMSWESSSEDFRMRNHFNEQFIDYVDPNFYGVEGNFIFLTESPWRIITPKGWSVLQLPMFYHFNSEFSAIPGVIDTDVVTQSHHSILYHGKGKEIEIKRGTPLALYIPFKRESTFLDLEVRSATEEDLENFNKVDVIFRKAEEYGMYRKMQRQRNKGLTQD